MSDQGTSLPASAEKPPRTNAKIKKRRKSVILKLFKFGTVLFFLIVALILSLPAIISASFVEQKIIDGVNSAIPGTIGWENLSLGVWSGDISITDFVVVTPQNDSAISFDTLRLQYELKDLFNKKIHITEVALIEPTIGVSIDSVGMINIVSAFVDSLPESTEKEPKEPSGSEFPFSILIDTIRVDSLSFDLQMADPSLNASVESIDFGAKVTLFPLTVSASLNLNSFTFTDGVHNVEVNSLDIGIEIDDQSVNSLSLDLRTDRDSLVVTGEVTDYLTDSIASIIDLSAYLSVVTLTQLAGKDLGNGGFSAMISLSDNINNPTVNGLVKYRGTNIASVPIQKIDLPLELTDHRINISSLELLLEDSITAEVTSALSLAELFPDGFLNEMGELSSLSYSAAANLNAPAIPADGVPVVNTVVDLSLDGRGVDPKTMNLTGELSASTESEYKDEPIILTVNSLIGMDSGMVKLDSTRIAFDDSDMVTLSGLVNLNLETMLIDGTVLPTNLNLFTAFVPDIDFSGELAAQFTVDGKLTVPSVTVQTSLDALNVMNYSLGDIDLSADINSDSGTISTDFSVNGELVSLDALLNLDLFDPGTFTLRESPLINADIHNGSFDLASVSGGVVTGNGDFALKYDGWIGDGEGDVFASLSKITLEQAGVEQATIDSIHLEVAIDDSLISLDTVMITLYDTISLDGSAQYHLNGSYEAVVHSDTIDPSEFVTVIPDELLLWTVIDMDTEGTVDDLNADITLSVPSLAWSELVLDTQGVSVAICGDSVTVTGDGIAELDILYTISEGFYRAEAVVDSFLLDPIFTFLKQPNFNGAVTATLFAEGTGSLLDSVEVAIPSIALNRYSRNLVSGENIAVSYGENGTIIDSFYASLLSTGELDISGTVTKDTVVDLNLTLNLPLEMIEEFTTKVEQLTGAVTLNSSLAGSFTEPLFEGAVEFDSVSLRVSNSMQELHTVSGGINFDNSGIRVSNLIAYLDNGSVQANGAINIDGTEVTSGDFRMDVMNLPIVVPDILDLKLGGYISVEADSAKQGIGGNIELLECYYFQYIDPVPAMGSSTPSRASVNERKTRSILDEIDLNVKVIPRQNIIVDNNLAFFEIKPELAITGKATSPSIEGRMSVLDGELNYLNRTFTVTRGVIDFVDPYKIAPELDIVAETAINNYDITIEVDGTVGEDIQYISTASPTLEDNEILSLILTGQLAADFNSQEFLMNQLTAAALDKLNASIDVEVSKSGMKIGEQLSRRLYTEYQLALEDGDMTQIAAVLVKLFDKLNIRSYATTGGEAGGEIRVNTQIR